MFYISCLVLIRRSVVRPSRKTNQLPLAASSGQQPHHKIQFSIQESVELNLIRQLLLTCLDMLVSKQAWLNVILIVGNMGNIINPHSVADRWDLILLPLGQ
uniref:Uncharacterized protein n=2 Tax=Picea TaxID=3328 RepID=A0A117NHM2_PICGL|nr:hypothetical protein ABT39_MTgene4545 [Picea glauca]QHR92733.1 hypothetical protein Q903MT_gene6781 [Picea sitchensis]